MSEVAWSGVSFALGFFGALAVAEIVVWLADRRSGGGSE